MASHRLTLENSSPVLFSSLTTRMGEIETSHSFSTSPSLPILLQLYLNIQKNISASSHARDSVIIVCSSHEVMHQLYLQLSLFSNSHFPIHYFPHLENRPYLREKAMTRQLYDRSKVLSHWYEDKPQFVLTDIKAFSSKVLSFEKPSFFRLEKGKKLSLSAFKTYLNDHHYVSVGRVQYVGEYSIRGSIIDLYSPHHEFPIRINLFDDEIEEMAGFDVEEQLSKYPTVTYTLSPLGYDIPSDEKQQQLISHLSDEFKKPLEAEMEKVGHLFDWHNYIPLFESTKSLADEFYRLKVIGNIYYMSPNSLVKAQEKYLLDATYFMERGDLLCPISPESYYVDASELIIKHKGYSILPFSAEEESGFMDSGFSQVLINRLNMETLLNDIRNKVKEGYLVVISAVYSEQIARLGRLFSDFQPTVVGLSNATKEVNTSSKLFVVKSDVEDGFVYEKGKVLWITENQLFGRKKRQRTQTDNMEQIGHFMEMKEGEYVVHINYGIGRYLGIERIDDGKRSKDFLKIEYANSSVVYVPIEQINLVQKYIGKKEGLALDDLNSKAWDRVKKRVKKEVEEIAKDLIELYSKRQNTEKVPFPPYNPFQIQFEADFPYEETEDQLRAFDEIQQDMEKSIAMDRLLCGDVGFGKTEVAMRAAFKSVMDGRQVVLMAPTTILSQQHYQTFSNRFKGYNVRVGVLNRFQTQKEIKQTLEDIKTGRVEILIGTHRVISDDVQFKKLGLLIIDEEQKFGVKQKEKIRQTFFNVDTLSLSATPIPRTLHMSLLEIRTLSLLKTPPSSRLPVKTVVMEFNEKILKEAILKEIEHGGQVFFLHNRVTDIHEVASYLRNLVGENVRIAVGHGQMSDELEDVMMDFIMGSYDVLVSTTIIDSGIDIPNTNTIIINNSHHLGLSQLYQLRGRVGRSSKQGYAYLFYAKDRELTEEASKRLHSILDFTELGSGFDIAMKDIEIRGVGNILGEKQSGNVSLVGYEMYCRLLEEAIGELKHDRRELMEVYLDVKYNGYIDDSYIPTTKDKVSIYKTMNSFSSQDDLDRFVYELYDRYGEPPQEVKNLINIAKMRLLCQAYGVFSVVEKAKKVTWTLRNKKKLNMEVLVKKIQKKELYLEGDEDIYVLWKDEGDNKIFKIIAFMQEIFLE